jgi:hypothetical protein
MTAMRDRTRELTNIMLKSVSIIVITLGLSSVANAQWVLDHIEGVSNLKTVPPWSLVTQQSQPPQNIAGLYLDRNTPNEWDLVLQWTDPASSVPDHGEIAIPIKITKTRCGAKTPTCDRYIGVGFSVTGQSLDSSNVWQDDGYLKYGSRTLNALYQVWVNENIQQAQTTTYFLFNPFYSTQNVRFIVYTSDGTWLKTYYYKKGGRQSLQPPILISPPNGATVPANTLQLVWRQNGDPGYQETFWLEVWYWDFASNQWKPYWQGYWNSPANFSGRKGTFAWRVFAVDPTKQSNPWFVASSWWKVTSQ